MLDCYLNRSNENYKNENSPIDVLKGKIENLEKLKQFSLLNALLFQEGLNLLFYFYFYFYILRFSERFDSHVSLPSFRSICAIAPLVICFDLKFKTMFNKITTSLSYNCISAFIILLQIFFCAIFCQYFVISVKVLMISCFQTLV